MYKNTFLKLIGNAKIYIIEYEDELYENEKSTKELKKDEYELICRDVLYMHEDTMKSGFYRAKYKDKIINDIEQKEYERLMEYAKQSNLIIKGLIWFYEKETRIQVQIRDEKLVMNKHCKVAIDIESILNEVYVRLAPEYDDDIDWDKYEGLKKWSMSKLEKSAYKGEIKMNLCRNCTRHENFK